MITERLKEIRLQKHMTQKLVGESIGTNEKTYQNYELGHSQPNIDTLNKILDILDSSADYLLGLTDLPCKTVFLSSAPFSARLKNVRIHAGITQREAAQSLGIKWRRYQSYESGERQPQLEGLAALAKFYQVSVDQLLGREPQGNDSGKE